MDLDEERLLRQRIFDRLAEELGAKGWLTRAELSKFEVDGTTYRLIDAGKGIWNPTAFATTLSILSKPDSKYSDAELDGFILYDYRSGGEGGDNRKLRRAFELQMPLIFLRWISDGVYVPISPVYVAANEREHKRVRLTFDKSLLSVEDPERMEPIERKYAKRSQRQRLHQPQFRGMVLLAYENQCAVCGLGHPQLLDAAHIIGDAEADGIPHVSNGICLCKLHHAAYDSQLLGISDKLRIHINALLMEDSSSSPTLRYALQKLDGLTLRLPRSKVNYPSLDRLRTRFAHFQAAPEEFDLPTDVKPDITHLSAPVATSLSTRGRPDRGEKAPHRRTKTAKQ